MSGPRSFLHWSAWGGCSAFQVLSSGNKSPIRHHPDLITPTPGQGEPCAQPGDKGRTHGAQAGCRTGAVLGRLPHQLVHRGQLVDSSTMDFIHGGKHGAVGGRSLQLAPVWGGNALVRLGGEGWSCPVLAWSCPPTHQASLPRVPYGGLEGLQGSGGVVGVSKAVGVSGTVGVLGAVGVLRSCRAL